MNTPSAVKFRIPRDIWIGIVTLIFAGIYWQAADGITISPLDGIVNAGALPKMLALALMLFSILLILRALMTEVMYLRAARRAAGVASDRPEEEAGKQFSNTQHLKAAGVLGIGIVYLLILPYLGYIVSVALLIGVMAVYIGAKPNAYTVSVAVGITIIFYLLFVQFLDIPLPSGFWPSLFG